VATVRPSSGAHTLSAATLAPVASRSVTVTVSPGSIMTSSAEPARGGAVLGSTAIA